MSTKTHSKIPWVYKKSEYSDFNCSKRYLHEIIRVGRNNTILEVILSYVTVEGKNTDKVEANFKFIVESVNANHI